MERELNVYRDNFVAEITEPKRLRRSLSRLPYSYMANKDMFVQRMLVSDTQINQ